MLPRTHNRSERNPPPKKKAPIYIYPIYLLSIYFIYPAIKTHLVALESPKSEERESSGCNIGQVGRLHGNGF